MLPLIATPAHITQMQRYTDRTRDTDADPDADIRYHTHTANNLRHSAAYFMEKVDKK